MIPISQPHLGEAEKDAVLRVLESGMLVQGAVVERLEDAFCRIVGAKHAVATSSGTTALHLALLAHGIGPGDEVITSSFTFVATVSSILYVGAKPIFADVEPDTFNLNPMAVEAAITSRTRAIIPVHLYGHPCEMDRFSIIAENHGLTIIEDAAQAIGATIRGKPVGSFGTAIFSLYATKNITSAEGGMLTTNDKDVAASARLLRNHGMIQRYHHQVLGYNFRMTDVHAAIGVAQIEKLSELTAKRSSNASYFNSNLKTLRLPTVKNGCEHVWHQYTVKFPGYAARNAAVAQLARVGIATGIFYPIPVHQQEFMARSTNGWDLPVTERLSRQVLSLPVHPMLSQFDLELIAHEVNKL